MWLDLYYDWGIWEAKKKVKKKMCKEHLNIIKCSQAGNLEKGKYLQIYDQASVVKLNQQNTHKNQYEIH